jgi:hypothetical protein
MARLSRLEYSFRFAVSEITTRANRRGDAAQVDAAVSGRSASSYASDAAVMRPGSGSRVLNIHSA